MTSPSEPQFRLGDGSESAHWYREGAESARCAYQILGRNGKWRQTNLRDARAHGLLPSVSTICRIQAAPGLEKWKRKQMMFAALTHPEVAKIGDHDELFKVLEKDGAEQAKQAAIEGSRIHAVVEDWIGTGRFPDDKDVPFLSAAKNALLEILPGSQRSSWETEVAVTHPYGYGGRVDIYADNIVVDFKSKEFDEDTKKLDVYANQGQALAAYRQALGMENARCFNVYLSRNNPGLYRVCEHPQDKLKQYWHEFVSLLYFFQVQKNLPLLAKPWELE